MNDAAIEQLVREIETIHFTQFWWDHPLLTGAAAIHDARVVTALALRHHALSNKEAYSAHVVRHAIRMSDGQRLPTLWALIDAEMDSNAIQERMDDFTYRPWAAAFIIGEVGGAPAFAEATQRLSSGHAPRHFLLVRLLSHLVVRYLNIEKESEPQTTFIDLKSGKSETLLSRYMSRPGFEMTRRKRAEANELFTPLPLALIEDAQTRLEQIPDALFNYPKPDFIRALNQIPKAKG